MKTLPTMPSREALRDMLPWLPRGAAVAAVTVGLALSAPLIWGAVAAGMGLLALAAFAAFGGLCSRPCRCSCSAWKTSCSGAQGRGPRQPDRAAAERLLRREQRLAVVPPRAGRDRRADRNHARRWSTSAATSTRRSCSTAQERALQKMTQFHDINVGAAGARRMPRC